MTSTGESTPLVAVMLIGWAPIVLAMFSLLPSRVAVIAAFVFAWLFLPVAGYDIRFLPPYTKMSATCVGVLVATLIFDSNRILKFRPSWVDAPMVIFCGWPFMSAVANGHGPYEGASAVFAQVVAWGMPYFIGRTYFTDLRGLKELAVGVFVGGLIYIPLCLYEIRMSPQLHKMVYGFHQHSFVQAYRWGSYRPTVFMGHGLMVSMWMTAASLTGLWFWATGAMKRILGLPLAAVVPVLLATTMVLRSTGALALLAIGMAVLGFMWLKPSQLPILCLAGIAILYMGVRATGIWSGKELVAASTAVFGRYRTESLSFRLENEELLARRAMQRPLVGWGRMVTRDDEDEAAAVSDGMWIIIFGVSGAVGLASFAALILLPPLLLRARASPRYWFHPHLAPAVCFACLLALWMIDNLFNAMLNPIFLLIAGGLAGLRITPATRWAMDVARERSLRRG